MVLTNATDTRLLATPIHSTREWAAITKGNVVNAGRWRYWHFIITIKDSYQFTWWSLLVHLQLIHLRNGILRRGMLLLTENIFLFLRNRSAWQFDHALHCKILMYLFATNNLIILVWIQWHWAIHGVFTGMGAKGMAGIRWLPFSFSKQYAGIMKNNREGFFRMMYELGG